MRGLSILGKGGLGGGDVRRGWQRREGKGTRPLDFPLYQVMYRTAEAFRSPCASIRTLFISSYHLSRLPHDSSDQEITPRSREP